jgi:hypothetical protein
VHHIEILCISNKYCIIRKHQLNPQYNSTIYAYKALYISSTHHMQNVVKYRYVINQCCYPCLCYDNFIRYSHVFLGLAPNHCILDRFHFHKDCLRVFISVFLAYEIQSALQCRDLPSKCFFSFNDK